MARQTLAGANPLDFRVKAITVGCNRCASGSRALVVRNKVCAADAKSGTAKPTPLMMSGTASCEVCTSILAPAAPPSSLIESAGSQGKIIQGSPAPNFRNFTASSDPIAIDCLDPRRPNWRLASMAKLHYTTLHGLMTWMIWGVSPIYVYLCTIILPLIRVLFPPPEMKQVS